MAQLDPQGKTSKTAPRAKTKAVKAAPKRATAGTSKKKASTAPAAAKQPKVPAVEATTPRVVSIEERHRMIAEAAYYVAQRSGFRGDPQRHWLVAEAEVDARLLRERARSG